MLTIRVSVNEKRATNSQFENVAVGADLEATNLECLSPEDVQRRTHELFQLARGAVQRQLLEMVPERSGGNGHAAPNGHEPSGQNGHAANGNGRSFGRPQPEVTTKQKLLLSRIARERNLSAEQVGEIARRECGRNVPQLDRQGMSHLLEALMAEEARP
jgi:hypothetical protein